MKKLTQEHVNKKYKGIYIEICKTYDYTEQQWLYDVIKKSKTIKENMTLGEDVGTGMEYKR